MAQQTLSPTTPTVSITPNSHSDGVPYAVSVPLTSTEASLAGGTGSAGTDPIGTDYGQAIVATVVLTVTGYITGQNSYVVMQMDMGDGVWVDLNWCVWTGNQGSATFVFSNGIAGANTLQQTRASGQVPNPQSNGSNQLCLGGRIRFVGKNIFVGGSSSISGTPAAVSATIKYKLLGLR